MDSSKDLSGVDRGKDTHIRLGLISMRELGDISWKQFEKFLLREGYQFKSVEGGHSKYKKPGLARPVIVPRHKKIPEFVIMTNLRTMGMTKEYFVKKMKKV